LLYFAAIFDSNIEAIKGGFAMVDYSEARLTFRWLTCSVSRKGRYICLVGYHPSESLILREAQRLRMLWVQSDEGYTWTEETERNMKVERIT
jgi:hypothetical protein